MLRALSRLFRRRQKSLEELAEDQAARERFFEEREAKVQTTGREWPNP